MKIMWSHIPLTEGAGGGMGNFIFMEFTLPLHLPKKTA